MQAKDIEKYLTQLGQELANQGLQKPIRVLIVGGAYMLLFAKMNNRPTDDIDVLFLDKEQLQRDLLTSTTQAIARKHQRALNNKWLNADAADLLAALGPIPEGHPWRNFGPLEIHIPNAEYILAVKLISTRDKDLTDAQYLCNYLQIRTKEQARVLVHTYIEHPEELYEICDLEGNLTSIGLL